MNTRRTNGFTVIETVIYLAVLVMFSLAVVGVLLSLGTSYRKLQLARTISDSASVSFERMTREVRGATNVDLAKSTLNVTPGLLYLNSTDDSGNLRTVKFALENGAINVYDNDVFEGPLTLPQASTTNLVFTLFQSGGIEGVLMKATIQASSTADLRSSSFETFVKLRNSH